MSGESAIKLPLPLGEMSTSNVVFNGRILEVPRAMPEEYVSRRLLMILTPELSECKRKDPWLQSNRGLPKASQRDSDPSS
jgi:hypothetical protein